MSILGVDSCVVLGPLAGGLRAAVASHSDCEVVGLKGLHVVHVIARRFGWKRTVVSNSGAVGRAVTSEVRYLRFDKFPTVTLGRLP